MYFSEPFTDFRTNLYTDNGQFIEVDFNVATGTWKLTVDKDVAKPTVVDLVKYLHSQFYLGEDDYLEDWLAVVDTLPPGRRTTLTLKTVDRL